MMLITLRYSNYYTTQDVGKEYIMISTSGLQSKTNVTKDPRALEAQTNKDKILTS